MHKPATLDLATRTVLITRLKSIEGQARGIQRMVDEGRQCQEIMDQLAALRAAAHAVSMRAFEAFALHCLNEPDEPLDRVVAQLTDTVAKLTH
jgi:CsoR family transcriptional regulator, copper-sensing transcriptional repressor